MGMSQLINEASGLLANFNSKKKEIDAAVAAAVSAVPLMERNYYVDAVLGDDVNNSGTSALPFKTIKKAIDSVPVGGSAKIELAPDQVYVLSYGKSIGLINKSIVITGKVGQPKPVIVNESVYSSSANTILSSGITLKNSGLALQFLKLKTSDRPEGYRDFASNGYGIISRQDLSSGWVGLYSCEVEINQTSFMRLANGGSSIDFSAYNTTVTRPGTGYLLDLDSGVPIKAMFTSMILPVGVKLGDLISNIIRDVNGNPNNVLCNVPLPASV